MPVRALEGQGLGFIRSFSYRSLWPALEQVIHPIDHEENRDRDKEHGEVMDRVGHGCPETMLVHVPTNGCRPDGENRREGKTSKRVSCWSKVRRGGTLGIHALSRSPVQIRAVRRITDLRRAES